MFSDDEDKARDETDTTIRNDDESRRQMDFPRVTKHKHCKGCHSKSSIVTADDNHQKKTAKYNSTKNIV